MRSFVMRHAAALGIALFLPAVADAAPRWTFCVAAAEGGGVWISEVFAAEGNRERLEGAFKSVVERMGAMNPNAQCPRPRDDRTVAVNAQIDAEAFNQRMGASLHAVPASDFPAGRQQASHEPPSHAKRGGPKQHDDQPIGSSGKPHKVGQ
jgi:hypothetical protein